MKTFPCSEFLRRALSLMFAALSCAAVLGAAERPPNIVLIFADDMGYADAGAYGATEYPTPHLDRLAAEGVKFTSFYVAQAVCSASRAALLTGCYPNRVSIQGALGPASDHGLHEDEWTVAEVLKTRGYATAIYGKWHLGHHPKFLPKQHGFDDYFGLPYSNDMWPHHPSARPGTYPDLPLIDGDQITAYNPDQTQLTTWYTERALKFIEANRNRPFFLYLPHSMPHVPLFVSDKFKGKSEQGLYGDVIMELDWSVGQILETLQKLDLDEKTLVLFTSDNGPWLLYGNHGGSAKPLREGKGTSFEGGVRVPFLARWPGKIPGGTVNHEMATAMDLLPTLAALARAPLPKDRKIDGRNIWPLLAGQANAKTPHEAFFYYWVNRLHAVRSGPWKLHFEHRYPKPQPAGGDGKPGQYAQMQIGLSLFNLDKDIGETTNVAHQHPEVVRELQALADRCREELGDSASGTTGSQVRPAGKL